MPPHLQLLTTIGAVPDPIFIAISGGEESAITTLEIWNDKLDAFVDTTTSVNQWLKVLTSSIIGYAPVTGTPIYGPYVSDGEPITEELWSRVRITHTLTAAGASTEGATDTLPVGTNSEFPLPDLAPQTGVRIEFQVIAPAGQTANATRIRPQVVGNQASSPLAALVGLASGSGVVPADRVAGLRAILRGSVVTADDSETVAVTGGLMVHDGTERAFAAEDVTFTLADGAAVNLGADEAYNVTLSRTSAGVLTVTKGPKTEAVLFPAVPAGNVLVSRLTVESADGIAVTVAPSSVDQSEVTYAELSVRAGAGLTAIVSPGDAISDSSIRPRASHATSVALTAASVNRIWLLPTGGKSATVTDVLPTPGAALLARATTDGANVLSVEDTRPLVHRAVTYWTMRLAYVGVISELDEPSELIAWDVLDEEGELEDVALDLSALDATWTAGTLRVDVRAIAPGVAVDSAGASIYTDDAQRPALAWDAASLRVTSADHQTRRFARGTRFVLDVLDTVAAPATEPAQEIRVALRFRRYT